MNQRTRLERLAIDAHRRGDTWPQFWPTVASDVAAAEPWDRTAYHRLVRRLSYLVTCGNADGMVAVGDGEPWQADDEAPMVPIIDDTTTTARCLWPRGEETRPQVDHEAIVTAGPRVGPHGQERTTRCGR